jgi:hypothetical protein
MMTRNRRDTRIYRAAGASCPKHLALGKSGYIFAGSGRIHKSIARWDIPQDADQQLDEFSEAYGSHF